MRNPLEYGFEQARAVADAVLFEGYVLYPYRASAAKNQLRWQFGVLVPPAWTATTGEHAVQRTECLLEPRDGDRLHAELRFLHVRRRTVERLDPDGGYTEVPELELPDRVLVPWDEGHEERVLVHETFAELTGDQAAAHAVRFDLPAAVEHEPVTDAEGRTVGRLVRHRQRLTGELRPRTEELPGPYRVLRLTVSVHNTTAADEDAGSDRETALTHSMIGAHLLLGVPGGRFLSVTDPPEWARPLVAGCSNDHTWPVLAGPPGTEDVLLSSPIILEDHPAVADESPAPSTTPPRSTRSSPCARPPSPSGRSARPAARTHAPRRSSTSSTTCRRPSGNACTGRSGACATSPEKTLRASRRPGRTAG